ncbi:MAG: hydroxymethylbilane synthase, partial [Opitutales bacterium]
MPVTIATRKSPLARKQTELVVDWIMERCQGCETEILPLSTQVDER